MTTYRKGIDLADGRLRVRSGEVTMHDLPTISGSEVGLPPNTIWIDPRSDQLHRTT